MTKPIITIVNAETGESETREMNDAELIAYEAIQADLLKEKQEIDAKKAKRLGLLEKLGITEEEAKLLLG
jgi:hypothetical protein